ncbi:MAG: YbgC/FadM family acyl-CoA thioesterase [bacterium]|nr:YbgC/FadM family acyl-CoA thioesterase [bacterium]
MNTVFEKRILNFHLDSFKIVHHARYLEIPEEARWFYCYENNLIDAFHSRGIYHVIVNINIDYRSSAAFGDVISVTTGLHQAAEKSVCFKQTIYNNKELLIDAEITNVFMYSSNNKVIPIQEMADFWEDL